MSITFTLLERQALLTAYRMSELKDTSHAYLEDKKALQGDLKIHLAAALVKLTSAAAVEQQSVEAQQLLVTPPPGQQLPGSVVRLLDPQSAAKIDPYAMGLLAPKASRVINVPAEGAPGAVTFTEAAKPDAPKPKKAAKSAPVTDAPPVAEPAPVAETAEVAPTEAEAPAEVAAEAPMETVPAEAPMIGDPVVLGATQPVQPRGRRARA